MIELSKKRLLLLKNKRAKQSVCVVARSAREVCVSVCVCVRMLSNTCQKHFLFDTGI